MGFYEKLYSDDGMWRPRLDEVPSKSLEPEDRELLVSPFSEEEVVMALRSMSGDKAPGLDGFFMTFFLGCWEVIKEDVLKVFHFFSCQLIFRKEP